MHKINIQHALERFKNPSTSPKTAPHELSASVQYIRDKIGFTKAYGGGYWSKRIKNSGKSFFSIKALVDTARGLDSKYNRGGFLSNKLK